MLPKKTAGQMPRRQCDLIAYNDRMLATGVLLLEQSHNQYSILQRKHLSMNIVDEAQ